MSNLVETKKGGETVYKGSFLELKKDIVTLPDGKEASREYLTHPGAVAILVIDSNNNIYIERQFRYPIGEVIYEIPAGKLEYGEDPLEAAKRELQEETGLVANELKQLGVLYPCVGYSNEIIYVYLVNTFENGKQNLDSEEFLDVIKIPYRELKKMILNGEIHDSKTLSAICMYEAR